MILPSEFLLLHYCGDPLHHRPFHSYSRRIDCRLARAFDPNSGRHSLFSHVAPPAALQSGIAGEVLSRSRCQVCLDERTRRSPQKIRDDSPNVAVRSPSFRNYADYMLTVEFQRAIADLINMAEHSRTAYIFP